MIYNLNQAQDEEILAVRRIREQDQNQIHSFKVLVVYFSIILLVKLIQLVTHWVSGSPIDSLWSHVALSLLSVVAIPVLIVRIRRLSATDYYSIPVAELVDAAKRRYRPLVSTLLLVAGFLLLLILFAPSVAEGNLTFIWGGFSGIVLGAVICYVRRRRFIRSIDLEHGATRQNA
jgi:hypothetical protein